MFLSKKIFVLYALFYYDYFLQAKFQGPSDQIHQKLHKNYEHVFFFFLKNSRGNAKLWGDKPDY